ncbi:MAG: hypothetical protein ACRER7_06895, partial [Gammaproteobacteria bacterium]
MSTVRNIERRMFIRRQTDRDIQNQGAGVAGGAGVGATAMAAGAGAHGWRLASIEWNGIWAGFMVWIGVETLLMFLVLGIGFSRVNPF